MNSEAEPSPAPPSPSRLRRVLAIGVGVAMVPALYAVASAATGSASSDPATVVQARAGADDPGTEFEVEHGVVVEKPHDGAATPSVPEVTTPTTPDVTTPTTPEATTPTVPDVTTPTLPEPGDDNGNDGGVAVPSGQQSFSSAGGSITVTVSNGALSLASSSPAAAYGSEVHDNGPSRVEVRFTNGQTEWRIRIELGSGALTSEITQHG